MKAGAVTSKKALDWARADVALRHVYPNEYLLCRRTTDGRVWIDVFPMADLPEVARSEMRRGLRMSAARILVTIDEMTDAEVAHVFRIVPREAVS